MRTRILKIMAFKNMPKSRERIKVGNKSFIVKYLSIKPINKEEKRNEQL